MYYLYYTWVLMFVICLTADTVGVAWYIKNIKSRIILNRLAVNISKETEIPVNCFDKEMAIKLMFLIGKLGIEALLIYCTLSGEIQTWIFLWWFFVRVSQFCLQSYEYETTKQ